MSVIIPPDSTSPATDRVTAGTVRLGLTVSKRQARRAVARNTVRRVLREAARHRVAALEGALAGARLPGRGLDILFRLKAPLPTPDVAGWATVKAHVRREADSLLDQLLAVLQSGEPSALLARPARESLAQSAQGPRAARMPRPGANASSGPAEIPK